MQRMRDDSRNHAAATSEHRGAHGKTRNAGDICSRVDIFTKYCIPGVRTRLVRGQGTLLLPSDAAHVSLTEPDPFNTCDTMQCAVHLCGFLKGLGVSVVLHLHEARSLALCSTARDFQQRFMAAKLDNSQPVRQQQPGDTSDKEVLRTCCIPSPQGAGLYAARQLDSGQQVQRPSDDSARPLPMLISACPGENARACFVQV
jgi:hypothetical protein